MRLTNKVCSVLLLSLFVCFASCKKEKSEAEELAAQVDTGSYAGIDFGTYQYWVPGVSYVTHDYSNSQTVLVTSSGSGVLPGGIRIKADKTYIWNSSWDGKVITGSWKESGDSGYPILLIDAQEGKSWYVGNFSDQGSDIIVYDGNSIWYYGKKIK
jgi:hypothetical protein